MCNYIHLKLLCASYIYVCSAVLGCSTWPIYVSVASAAQFDWAGQNPGVSYLMPDFMIGQLICAQIMILNHDPMLLQDDG